MKVTLPVVDGPHQGSVFTFKEPDTSIVGRAEGAHFRLPVKDKYKSRCPRPRYGEIGRPPAS
jgi:hypothetical protein